MFFDSLDIFAQDVIIMKVNKKAIFSTVVLTVIVLTIAVWFFFQKTHDLYGHISKQYRDVEFSKQSLVSHKINDYSAAWVYGSRGRGNELFFFFLDGNKVIYSKIFSQPSGASPLEWGYSENSSGDSVVICGIFLKNNIDYVAVDHVPQDKIQYSSLSEVTTFFSIARKDKNPVKITGYKGDKAIFKNYPE
ncbi:MAG: hypothetical protein K0R28_2182 [Paenibacillus sp.]|jgi:hypothetical protein|nr:hypothetical protein [Paenibacillus sp.]